MHSHGTQLSYLEGACYVGIRGLPGRVWGLRSSTELRWLLPSCFLAPGTPLQQRSTAPASVGPRKSSEGVLRPSIRHAPQRRDDYLQMCALPPRTSPEPDEKKTCHTAKFLQLRSGAVWAMCMKHLRTHIHSYICTHTCLYIHIHTHVSYI